MKSILFSTFLHILIFISAYTFNPKKGFQIDSVGTNPTISNVTTNFSLNKRQVLQEEIKKEIIEEKPIEKPVIEEKKEPEKLKEIGTKEVVKPKKKIKKEIPKKIKKKKIIKKEPIKEKVSTEKPEQSSSKEIMGKDFIQLSKGVYAAKNQGVKGLSYSFISQPEPNYPTAAKRLGYNREVIIKVKFLVGFNGKIEDIKFYGKDNGLGFHREVEKALMNWKLTPITVQNKKVKLYFYKVFKFNQI